MVYLFSNDPKSGIVESLLLKSNMPCLSTQVLNELINVLVYKLKVKSKSEIKELINDLAPVFTVAIIDISTIEKGLDVSVKYGYRYFDSLIIASALKSNCMVLYSEDLHHDQLIEEELLIVNPFI